MAGVVLAGLELIGLVANSFSIVQAGQAWAASQHPKTLVRVYAGLSQNKSQTFSGNVPGITIWDANGDIVGHKDGSSHKIADGSFQDIEVNTDGRSAEYIAISNGGIDALCIAMIAVTNADGGQSGWFGDVGKACGVPWFYQRKPFGPGSEVPGNTPDTPAYRPACTWIDRDDSNGLVYQGMSMHLPDFFNTQARNYQFTIRNDTLCNSVPRFSMWRKMKTQDTIPVFATPPSYNQNGTDVDLTAIIHPETIQANGSSNQATGPSALENLQRLHNRRRKRQIISTMPDHLVISNIDSHSARELCESETSMGPDFVSLVEELFCDMSAKQLWPICSTSIASSCFDTATNSMRYPPTISSGNWTGSWKEGFVNVTTSQKSYNQVSNWS